jgi:hypothetical protein
VETGNPPEDDDFLRDDRELVRARIDAADDTAQIKLLRRRSAEGVRGVGAALDRGLPTPGAVLRC